MRAIILAALMSGPLIINTYVVAQIDQKSASAEPITRKILLTAFIDGGKLVDHVEVRRIDIIANQRTPSHVHPCPVVGVITSGRIVFQVEGQAEQILNAGDAFYEPANTAILHFDTAAESASFTASFLLGKGQQNTIRMLTPQ
jgi:quercetin dioxygenase-like cupin family protein